jgi:hypothetical protein
VIDDIVKWLRALSDECEEWWDSDDNIEGSLIIAADLIEAQQAEIERLRAALEVAADHMSISGAPQATIDAIRKAVRGG